MKLKNAKDSNQYEGPEVAQVGKARTQNVPSPEEIRQRAYEIHMERGGTHGQDVDDWLQAERELGAKNRIG
jgi:Protein of unknown function (DUF2934)